MESEEVRVGEKLVITRKGIKQIARYLIAPFPIKIDVPETANVMFNADRSIAFVSCTLEVPVPNFAVDVDRD